MRPEKPFFPKHPRASFFRLIQGVQMGFRRMPLNLTTQIIIYILTSYMISMVDQFCYINATQDL